MIKKTNHTTIALLLSCFLYGAFNMSGAVAKPYLPSLFTKTYKYTIRVGAPYEYEMVYDFNENYFTNQQGKPLLRFTAVGGSPGSSWADGDQATSVSEVNPLPHGIKVRWFSVAENQFWEGRHQFDQAFLQKLSRYTVNNINDREKNPFMASFSFTVNAVPNGLVTVWITGGGEKYVVAQFQAQRAEEPNWQAFSRSTLQRQYGDITREAYIKERFNKPSSLMATQTKQQIEAGQFPKNAAPWQRLMETYPWVLTVNHDFQLKDYWAWYTNGEKRFTYATDEQSQLPPRAVPYFISFFIEDRQQKLNRLEITFDKEEIMQGFERFASKNVNFQPITLQLKITPDLAEVFAYLVMGEHKVELEKIKPTIEDLYNNGL